MVLVALSRKQVRALDATASLIGLTTEKLMERAGYELAQFIASRVSTSESILFLCGSGNNGGDGLVAARHLSNLGFQVSVLLTSASLSEASAANYRIIDHMQLPSYTLLDRIEFSPFDVFIDCLLGYDQRKAPSGPLATFVERIAAANKRVLACDSPTGLDCSTGAIFSPHLRAQATLTFAAPKTGFELPAAKALCGQIVVAGIGIPHQVYQQLGLAVGSYLVEGTQEWG